MSANSSGGGSRPSAKKTSFFLLRAPLYISMQTETRFLSLLHDFQIAHLFQTLFLGNRLVWAGLKNCRSKNLSF